MKEIEDSTNRWKHMPCSWIGGINIVKMTKATYRFSAVSVTLPMAFFTHLEQNILKCVWEKKRSLIAKTILRKKYRAVGIMFPDFRPYYKATIMKTVQYWQKHQIHNQWHRIESPEINPCTYGQFVLRRRMEEYTVEKTVSSISGAGKI